MAVILGIDVAKSKFDAALFRNGKYKNKSFPNTHLGFQQLAAWLKQHDEASAHVCMEATGSYWETLAKFLFSAGHTVSVVNPARIKAFGKSELLRTKNDKVDAKLIARFCEALKPSAWHPDPPEVEHLRMLGRRRDALINMKTQEENRLGGPDDSVNESIEKVIAFLDKEIEEISKAIKEHINKHDSLRNKRTLLETIPGVGLVTIEAILSEVNGFEGFNTVKQVDAYMGLSPRENTSGSSVKGKGGLCKIGNARLRKVLYMPALSAIQHNPVIAALYKRLMDKSKNGMIVACACMKKLVHIIYGVIKTQKPFDPEHHLKTA